LFAILDQELEDLSEAGASRGGVTGIGRFLLPRIPHDRGDRRRACVSAASPLLAGISAARAQFNAKYSNIPTLSFADSGETATLSGVGFFDFKHSQNGVAPNGIELHPVTAICFGRGCAPAASPPPAARSGGCATAGDAPLWLALLLMRRRSSRA
jgi:hypothetical protein